MSKRFCNNNEAPSSNEAPNMSNNPPSNHQAPNNNGAPRSNEAPSSMDTSDPPNVFLPAAAQIDSWIKSYPVVIFSLTHCYYCFRAKRLLSRSGIHDSKMLIIELDEMPNSEALKRNLQELTGRGTVPSIFFGGRFIGGCDDLVSLNKRRELGAALEEVGAK